MALQKRKPKVLDMGAGYMPHPQATHAVDFANKIKLDEEDKSNYKIEYHRNLENKLKSMDYKLKINYNTQRLPWPNNSFNKVYSNGSLGTYGKLHAFQEAYRVLKHGGKLEYGMVEGTKEEIQKKMILPYKAGFINIHSGKIFITAEKTKRKPDIIFTNIIATKP